MMPRGVKRRSISCPGTSIFCADTGSIVTYRHACSRPIASVVTLCSPIFVSAGCALLHGVLMPDKQCSKSQGAKLMAFACFPAGQQQSLHILP